MSHLPLTNLFRSSFYFRQINDVVVPANEAPAGVDSLPVGARVTCESDDDEKRMGAGGGTGGVLETYARRRREWPLLNLSVIPRGTELTGVISILTNE